MVRMADKEGQGINRYFLETAGQKIMALDGGPQTGEIQRSNIILCGM